LNGDWPLAAGAAKGREFGLAASERGCAVVGVWHQNGTSSSLMGLPLQGCAELAAAAAGT
jgi:hypothetical protein